MVALTVHVYVLPFVRPVTTIGLVVPVCEPNVPLSVDVHSAVKLVISEPLSAPAVNVTLALALPRVAVPMVGASGTVSGTTAFDAAESGPVPTPLVAFTVHV